MPAAKPVRLNLSIDLARALLHAAVMGEKFLADREIAGNNPLTNGTMRRSTKTAVRELDRVLRLADFKQQKVRPSQTVGYVARRRDRPDEVLFHAVPAGKPAPAALCGSRRAANEPWSDEADGTITCANCLKLLNGEVEDLEGVRMYFGTRPAAAAPAVTPSKSSGRRAPAHAAAAHEHL